MERRCFLKNVAAATAGTTTGAMVADPLGAEEIQERPKLRVTVLRVSVDQELNERYYGGEVEPCPIHKVGQEFIFTSPYRHPEGFCPWAWADIRASITLAYSMRGQPTIACCTDGVRPVFFLIEETSG